MDFRFLLLVIVFVIDVRSLANPHTLNEQCPCVRTEICPRVYGASVVDVLELGVVPTCESEAESRCCGVSVEVAQGRNPTITESVEDDQLESNSVNSPFLAYLLHMQERANGTMFKRDVKDGLTETKHTKSASKILHELMQASQKAELRSMKITRPATKETIMHSGDLLSTSTEASSSFTSVAAKHIEKPINKVPLFRLTTTTTTSTSRPPSARRSNLFLKRRPFALKNRPTTSATTEQTMTSTLSLIEPLPATSTPKLTTVLPVISKGLGRRERRPLLISTTISPQSTTTSTPSHVKNNNADDSVSTTMSPDVRKISIRNRFIQGRKLRKNVFVMPQPTDKESNFGQVDSSTERSHSKLNELTSRKNHMEFATSVFEQQLPKLEFTTTTPSRKQLRSHQLQLTTTTMKPEVTSALQNHQVPQTTEPMKPDPNDEPNSFSKLVEMTSPNSHDIMDGDSSLLTTTEDVTRLSRNVPDQKINPPARIITRGRHVWINTPIKPEVSNSHVISQRQTLTDGNVTETTTESIFTVLQQVNFESQRIDSKSNHQVSLESAQDTPVTVNVPTIPTIPQSPEDVINVPNDFLRIPQQLLDGEDSLTHLKLPRNMEEEPDRQPRFRESYTKDIIHLQVPLTDEESEISLSHSEKKPPRFIKIPVETVFPPRTQYQMEIESSTDDLPSAAPLSKQNFETLTLPTVLVGSSETRDQRAYEGGVSINVAPVEAKKGFKAPTVEYGGFYPILPYSAPDPGVKIVPVPPRVKYVENARVRVPKNFHLDHQSSWRPSIWAMRGV